MSVNTSQLYSIQKDLCDEFITNVDFMDKIMSNYLHKIQFHHQYSIRNILLANEQLFIRTGETTELLAPYNAWNEIERNVKKGEKALYIIYPMVYENEDGKTEVYFNKGPVFDISQTEGKPFMKEYIENSSNITFNDIVSYVSVPIHFSNKEITRGYTDGKKIWISKHISDDMKICVLFHELAHFHLHFGEDREEISKDIKELEAEVISYLVTSALGIKNYESATYIRSWAGENAPEKIRGKGAKLISIAQKFLEPFENLFIGNE